ncbi:MAG: DUF2069 domain-containing protein [Ignavibacteria bacterium]
MQTARILNRGAIFSLVALIALCVAWEWRLAPLRAGGSTLVLKALPLMAALPGILRGRRYTHQWASLLSLAYAMEGIVRGMTESGVRRWLALSELALSVALFGCTAFYARASRRAPGAAEDAR